MEATETKKKGKIKILKPLIFGIVIFVLCLGVPTVDLVKKFFFFYEFTLSPDESYYIVSHGVEHGAYKVENGAVVLPSEHYGKPVKAVGNMGVPERMDRQTVGTLLIPEGIERIENSAFSAWSFQSISLPDTLQYLGDNALGSLESVDLTEHNGGYYLGNEKNPYMIFVKPLKSGLTEYSIQKGTRFIYDEAFLDYESLESIEIPDTVICILGDAFSGCSKLQSVAFPDGLLHIGAGAFSDCSKLQSVALPDGLLHIGGIAFSKCDELTSVSIPDSIESIGNDSFPGGKFQYNEYEGGRYLGNTANPYFVLVGFADTVNLDQITEFTISDRTKYIADHVFWKCENLTTLKIPDSVVYIDASAFAECENLKELTIGKNVKRIGKGAWNNCEQLTEIVFKGTVAEWEAIGYKKDVTVKCTDGTVEKEG